MTGHDARNRQARHPAFTVLAGLGLLALAGCQDREITGPAQGVEPQFYNTTSGYWEVNTTADQVVGSCDARDGGGADCTLREAVEAASPGDEIHFAESLTGTITLCSTCYQISISKDLTIVGPGPDVLAVSGNDQAFRVFALTKPWDQDPPSITLSGLTIRDGGEGGVSISNGAQVVLDYVVITDNGTSGEYSDYAAGIVVSGWSHLNLRNSAVANNTSTASSGYGNGGIVNNNSYVTIERSTISNNSSDGYGVGGIRDGGDMTLENGTVSGNSSPRCPDVMGGSSATVTINGERDMTALRTSASIWAPSRCSRHRPRSCWVTWSPRPRPPTGFPKARCTSSTKPSGTWRQVGRRQPSTRWRSSSRTSRTIAERRSPRRMPTR